MNIKSKNSKGSSARPKKRTPRKITPTYLHNSGLYYLQRFSSSAANFKAVMMRKVKKSCMHHTEQDYDECAGMVDQLVEKFQESGLLNDGLYTRGAISTLRRQGKSKKLILAKLRAKGLKYDDIVQAIDEHDQEKSLYDNSVNPELKAALTHARKKRLGPFKKDSLDKTLDEEMAAKQYKKALSSMARAGFSYQTSLQALSSTHEDAQNYIK